MNEQELNKAARFLQQSIAPANRRLNRDLWPQMRQRLAERSGDQSWATAMISHTRLSAVPWFDWALLAVLIVGICVFPNSIPIWLYHF
jgi:hypothetical protein